MRKYKVYIEKSDLPTRDMFIQNGFSVVDQPYLADLICFTGGADVSPMLYEMVAMPSTHYDGVRDQDCSDIFHTYCDTPMVGICRGGQFLNVMMGGELFQHIDNHNIGQHHDAFDPETGQIYEVTSGHHQMMIPTPEGEVLLVAEECSSRLPTGTFVNPIPDKDIEAVVYEESDVLCFQPHPEWVNKDHECQKLFFNMIFEYLL